MREKIVTAKPRQILYYGTLVEFNLTKHNLDNIDIVLCVEFIYKVLYKQCDL